MYPLLGDGGLITKSCPTLVTPGTVAPQASLSMGFPGKNTAVGYHSYSMGSSWPRDQTVSPALKADSLPLNQQVKVKSVSHSVMSNSWRHQVFPGISQARTLWSGLPFPPPGDLPIPGIKPHLLKSRSGGMPNLSRSGRCGIYLI